MANIRTRLANSLEKGDLLSTVRSTFKELLDSSVNGSSQSTCSARKDVYVFVLDHLETEDIAKDTGQQLVSILLVEADNLETKTASDIAYKILDKVKNGTASKGRSLELFPKLLSSMMESADGALEEKCGVDADKERSRLLDTLCTIRWPPNNVCALITMCRDIKLSNRELKMLFTKAFQTMKSMRPAELPPVIYQLIALSTKGHRGVVLNRVVMLFNDLDKEVAEKGDPSESDITVAIPRNELLQTEGTVMVHISFAIRQQQELGRELVDAVKTSLATASDSLMSPFCVAMLLSVSRIHGLQDQVFTLLKSAVTNSIKDIERWQCCRWIRETSAPVVKMEDLLQHTVRNSVQGWDSVLKGLVSFALCLMEGFSPKFPNASFGDLHSVQQQVCNIGSRLLIHIYEIHRIARKEIVKQILKSVITSSSTYSKHYIGILARLVRKTESRETVLDPDCIKTIEEVLNYLPFLPLAPAEDFMEAVQPLLKYSVSLKESLLVVLRNALLSKRTDGRCIAVKGYLLLLRNAEILDDALLSSQSSQPMSGSQVFVELHGTNMAASNEALCLEIIGNLRRCLTQQVEVRRNLYEGICAVFCTNEKLQLPILEFLLDHLLSLVLDDSNNPLPINLDKCLAQLPSGLTSIWEPVDSLLSALVLCYLRYKSSCDADGSTVSPVALKICDCLRSLALKTAKVEAGNLGIEKDADFSATSNAGSRNLCVLSLTARCCEVLLEFVFGAGDFSTQSCDQVLQLHSSRQSLLKTVAEKGGSSGAKRPHGKVPSATQGYFQSCMSLPSLLAMFKALHNDTLPSHQPGLAVLRDSIPFCKQILTASLQIMSSLLETSRCNGMCSVDYQEEVTNVLQGFGRSYLKQLQLACLRGQEREDSGSKGKSIVSLSLEGLQSILTLSTRLEDKCLGILTFISSSEDTEASLSATSLHLIRKFQKLVNGALSDPPELDVLGMRDVVAMANIIQHLSTLLDEEMMADVLKWAYDICREQNRDDVVFCKGFMTLLFALYQRCDSGSKLVKKACVDIHIAIGDVDEEVDIRGKKILAAITPVTASPCCLTLLLSHMEASIGHVEWFVSRIKPEADNPAGLDSIEAVCKEQLVVLIHSFQELTQTSISPGPLVDTIIKLVTRLYNILKDVTKHMLAMYTLASLCDLPGSFVNMVDLTGAHLNPSVYSYIHYIQSAQLLMGTDTGPGKKGKGKVVANSRKVHKELRCIPPMIYAVEEYEKFLIKMGKKAKVDLMKNFKRSTSRDFKINSAAVTAILADEMDDEPSELMKEGPTEEEMCT